MQSIEILFSIREIPVIALNKTNKINPDINFIFKGRQKGKGDCRYSWKKVSKGMTAVYFLKSKKRLLETHLSHFLTHFQYRLSLISTFDVTKHTVFHILAEIHSNCIANI